MFSVLRLIVATTVLLALTAREAGAQARAQVRLRYERNKSASSCPDEAVLRESVVARLGYDPFDAASEQRLEVVVSGRGARKQARVSRRDAAGKELGAQSLESTASGCAELADALALTVSIAIDPLAALAAQPPAAPAAPASAEAPVVAVPAKAASPTVVAKVSTPGERPSTPSKATPASWALGAGAGASLYALPGLSGSFLLHGALHLDRYALALEGRFDLPRTEESANGKVTASLWLGRALGCLQFGGPLACLVASAGVLRGRGIGLDHPSERATPYASVGLRGGYAYPLTSDIALGAHVELSAPLWVTRLKVDDREVWRTPTLGGAAYALVVCRLP